MTGRRRPRRRESAGFTLIELMVTIVLMAIFSIALYGFFFAGLDRARSQQTQWMAQSTGRTAIDRITADVQQSVSPDDGLNAPVISVSPTRLELYVDPSRSPTSTTPRPWHVRYDVVGGQLQRLYQVPINSSPPFSYSAWSPPDVLLTGLQNGATPAFAAFTEQGAALPATPAPSQMRDVAQVSVRLLVGQTTGAKATTLELSTDVALRNASHL